MRLISNLKWAEACARPKCIPRGRPRGAKAAGLAYERDLATRLPFGKHGQWFEYEDGIGHGWCQTDVILEMLGRWIILEAKYTWTPEAHLQVERLYRPIVEMAFGKPTVGIVVCKRLEPSMPGTTVVADLWQAIQLATGGRRPVFHWLGKSTITSPRLLDLQAA